LLWIFFFLSFRFGNVSRAQVKQGKVGSATNYGFIEYENEHSNSDAIRSLDGQEHLSHTLSVREANPSKPSTSSLPRGRKQRGYRIMISNLDMSVTWEELKDFTRNTSGFQVIIFRINSLDSFFLLSSFFFR
jgi:RNA recognition motif-containing protein